MDWAVDFIDSATKENLKFLRETIAAKHQAENGNYGEAARILWEVTIEARHSGNRRWECMTMVHMGKVYRVLRWGIAVKLFEEAIRLADEIGFDRAKMMALNDLGEMHCSWGQLERSLQLLERSGESTIPLAQVKEQIRQHLEKQALERRYRKWMKGLRDRTFVKIMD